MEEHTGKKAIIFACENPLSAQTIGGKNFLSLPRKHAPRQKRRTDDENHCRCDGCFLLLRIPENENLRLPACRRRAQKLLYAKKLCRLSLCGGKPARFGRKMPENTIEFVIIGLKCSFHRIHRQNPFLVIHKDAQRDHPCAMKFLDTAFHFSRKIGKGHVFLAPAFLCPIQQADEIQNRVFLLPVPVLFIFYPAKALMLQLHLQVIPKFHGVLSSFCLFSPILS